MKKTIVVISAFLSSSIFAYGNEPVKAIYCPKEIACTYSSTTNSYTSCESKFISDPKYFGKLNVSRGTATFQFVSAIASFHSSSTIGTCQYQYGGVGAFHAEVPIKPESNVEAYYLSQNPSAWIFQGGQATCESSKSTDCPLKERPGFVVHNVNVTGGIHVKADNGGISINTAAYAGMNDEDALYACGNVTQCTMDIMSGRSLKYGSIKIDMDTMKILEITNDYPTKVQINKIEPFNSIEVKYTSLAK